MKTRVPGERPTAKEEVPLHGSRPGSEGTRSRSRGVSCWGVSALCSRLLLLSGLPAGRRGDAWSGGPALGLRCQEGKERTWQGLSANCLPGAELSVCSRDLCSRVAPGGRHVISVTRKTHMATHSHVASGDGLKPSTVSSGPH